MKTADIADITTSAGTLPAIGAQWTGGIFAGVTVHQNRPMGLVLLPAKEMCGTWQSATEWAAREGGMLPSRLDALVLDEYLRGHFKTDDWYWTATVHPDDADRAFYQDFEDGTQSYGHKSIECLARAVRRVEISQ